MKGGCTDLRNAGPNSKVKVFSAATGKLIRTDSDKGYTPGHFTNMPPSRRNDPPYGVWLGFKPR